MTNQAPLTNEQKVAQVKGILMQNLNQFYSGLVNFIRTTPIDEKIKEFSIMNLDQGVMWFEQGVKKLNFQVEAPEPAPTPDAPIAPPEEPNAPIAPQEPTPCEGEEVTQPEGEPQ